MSYVLDRLRNAAAVVRRAALREGDDPERGDVPGWVLVTLMTAGLVVTLQDASGADVEHITAVGAKTASPASLRLAFA